MKAILIASVAFALLTASVVSASAWGHPAAPLGGGIFGGGGGGGKFLLCPTPAGIMICVIAGAGIVHELRGPACASNSRRNVANGWNYPRFWRPLCNWKDPARRRPRPAVVSARW